MTDREAYITLNMVSGVGPLRMAALCGHFGSPARILEASARELGSVQGIGEVLASEIAGWRRKIDADAEIKLAERGGVKIITKDEPAYPKILRELPDSPLCIYVRGELDPDEQMMIAIVGSRRITNYGRSMAEHLASSAAFAGWTVVSGLAFGIDAAAHQAVVNAKGRTVAVLGGGLARFFPQEHIPLAKKIIETGGAVISEFPMEFPPNRRSFPMRNRIISGLSRGVIVVEAGLVSGAVITANFANEQGRLVFAVPGQADNPQARGCHHLIKDGAKLTESFEDVIEEFEFLPGFQGDKGKAKAKTESDDAGKVETAQIIGRKDLDAEETLLLKVLGRGEQSADSLADETAMNTGKLLSTLLKLEMKKLVVQMPGKRFSIRSEIMGR